MALTSFQEIVQPNKNTLGETDPQGKWWITPKDPFHLEKCLFLVALQQKKKTRLFWRQEKKKLWIRYVCHPDILGLLYSISNIPMIGAISRLFKPFFPGNDRLWSNQKKQEKNIVSFPICLISIDLQDFRWERGYVFCCCCYCSSRKILYLKFFHLYYVFLWF